KSEQDVIRAVAFSADGKTLVSGDGKGTISVWDMAAGKERAALKASSQLRVETVLFSADDKVLAVSSSPAPTEAELGLRDEVRLWDTATLKELCALQTTQLGVSSDV